MTDVTEIPLSPEPQKFDMRLGGENRTIRLHYRNGWLIDIDELVKGLPLVTGVDLLIQLDYLDIGGSLVVQTDTDKLATPTLANLGSRSHLYFIAA